MEDVRDVRINTESIPDDVVDKEQAMILAKYYLSSYDDIPPSERKHFEHYAIMISKACPLSNIERKDIPYYQTALEFVAGLVDIGLYEYAREIQAMVLQELLLSRGVGGKQLIIGTSGVRRSEAIEKIVNEKQKKSFKSKISGIYTRNKPPMEEY